MIYAIKLILYIIFKFLIMLIPLLLSICILTILERTLIGNIQRRKGPNIVGYAGLLQPIADGLKLLLKETIIPSKSSRFIFLIAPIGSFFLSLGCWACIPITNYTVTLANPKLGLLYIFALTSLNVYNVIMAGWASNSKYAFLGSLRSAAQMISYELSLGFIILTIAVCAGSFNLTKIVVAQTKIFYIVPLNIAFVLFLIIMLAETNRHPFDLPEAESELVSGYNVEYAAMTFALFFLAEYGYILLMSALGTVFFLGGWLPIITIGIFKYIPGSFWFGSKMIIFIYIFIIARAALPRYRYDQLMKLGWKVFLPISFSYFFFISTICFLFIV